MRVLPLLRHVASFACAAAALCASGSRADTPWAPRLVEMGLDAVDQGFPQVDGRGVHVAVIDTGIECNAYDCPVDGYDTETGSGQYNATVDSQWGYHGSSVAGYLAAKPYFYGRPAFKYRGFAPRVVIHAIRVDPHQNFARDLHLALRWVKAHPVIRIVTFTVFGGANRDETQFRQDVLDLSSAGVFIASNNNWRDMRSASFMAGGYEPPNSMVNPMLPAVGAKQIFAEREWGAGLSYSGGLATPVDDRGNFGSWLAPQLAGAAALVLQIWPTYTPAQVATLLFDTGTPIVGPDPAVTSRLLDVFEAVKAVCRAHGNYRGTPCPASSFRPAPPSRP